jgi:hypothetical protein
VYYNTTRTCVTILSPVRTRASLVILINKCYIIYIIYIYMYIYIYDIASPRVTSHNVTDYDVSVIRDEPNN